MQDVNGEPSLPKNMRIEYIPKFPATLVSETEYFDALYKVPAGKVIRWDDIMEYLRCKHDAKRVELIPDKILTCDEKMLILVWRKLSTRGFLQDSMWCNRESQEEMLKAGGLTVVPYGAYRKSLKAEDYQKYLFDFKSLQ